MAAAVTRDADLAREAVQEGFARAYERRADFRDEGSLDGWVWRIVLRVALALRQGRPAPAVELIDAVDVALPFPERDPDLAAALSRLSARKRLIVFLRYFADLSYAEIAEILGVAEGTVSATLAQAKAELRTTMAGPTEVKL